MSMSLLATFSLTTCLYSSCYSWLVFHSGLPRFVARTNPLSPKFLGTTATSTAQSLAVWAKNDDNIDSDVVDAAEECTSGTLPSTMNILGDDSVHLKLQHIASAEDDTSGNESTTGSDGDNGSPRNRSELWWIHEYVEPQNQSIVAACLGTSASGKKKLDHFLRHVNERDSNGVSSCNNISTENDLNEPKPDYVDEDSSARVAGTGVPNLKVESSRDVGATLIYQKTALNATNKEQYAKYQLLWSAGKFLTQSKSIAKDWLTAQRQQRKLLQGKEQWNASDDTDISRPTVQEILTTNTRRIKLLVEDTISVPTLLQFLKAQNFSSCNTVTTTAAVSWQQFRFNYSASRTEALQTLKSFSQWFRDQFPYYYDQCLQCANNNKNQYLGTVHPDIDESTFLASRTELYLCGNCSTLSRFPRYNDVCKVLETRRGRCGEYSVLMMLFLHGLGYQARWVVDRDDHVWTEVAVDGDWVHIDPCEAAVDEPLIYQGWGKNQTFIVAYHYPSSSTSGAEDSLADNTINAFTEPNQDEIAQLSSHRSGISSTSITNSSNSSSSSNCSSAVSSWSSGYHGSSSNSAEDAYVIDVTLKYTSNASAVFERRSAEGVTQQDMDAALAVAETELFNVVHNHHQSLRNATQQNVEYSI